MKKAFYYGEYHIPQAVKDLFVGQTGTKIIKLLLEQHIEETDSKMSKVLLETIFDEMGLYGWNDENYGYSVILPNERAFAQWKQCIAPFREWLEESHNVTIAHEVEQLVPYDILLEDENNTEDTVYWKARKYFFQDVPTVRGFGPENIINGNTEVHDQIYPSRA